MADQSSSLFSSFVGNGAVVSAIQTALFAAEVRKKSLGHLLMSGPSGVGKTMLAKLIAQGNGGTLHRVHAPSLNKNTDLSVMLLTMSDKDVLFIDEIHALKRETAETLFEAMAEQQVSIVTDEREAPVTVPISDITIIGATTDHNKMPEAFGNRFYRHLRLSEYTVDELIKIQSDRLFPEIANHPVLENIPEDALLCVAQRSRGRARNALNMLSVLIDHVICRGYHRGVTESAVFIETGVGPYGASRDDRNYLQSLVNFGGKAGLTTISGALRLDRSYLENFVEPFLLNLGVIEKTPRGRILHGNEGVRQEILEFHAKAI